MNTLTSVSPVTTSETELLDFLIHSASINDYPVALWRLPESDRKHLLISYGHEKLKDDVIIEDLKPGFIFAPFEKKERVYLPADFIFSFENGFLYEDKDTLSESSARWLEKNFDPSLSKKRVETARGTVARGPEGKDESFLSLIHLCMAELEKGTFEKIVPSRTRQIDLPADFDHLRVFEKLCATYKHALVSFVNIPGIGCWIGASPEMLVSVTDKTIFKTVALAGTQPFREGMSVRSVAWTQKEIEEQALVERYVISCFKKIRLREYEEHGPKTVVAGNLIHLKSDFTVDMKATNFPNLGSTMLTLLHPTSAVCGMPLEPSLEFLKANEGYDRSFYSGFLGPVNVKGNIDIFVNLRCMQVLEQKAILYAGAGVTIDSIPEQEFEETEMKFNTLLNVIF
jgi:isochorismate synthase